MTEEKMTKLAEEDLDLVVGGGEYHDVYITPSVTKPGMYDIKIETFIGDPEAYRRYRAGEPMGELKHTIGIQKTGCPAKQLNARRKYYEEQGYTIH